MANGSQDAPGVRESNRPEPATAGTRVSGNSIENGGEGPRAGNGGAGDESRSHESRERDARNRGRRRRGSRGRGRRGRPILEDNPALSTSVSREGQPDEGSS
jgi:hypothetical protein